MIPLEKFLLPKDKRKWKSVCEQRRRLAMLIDAYTDRRTGIVRCDLQDLRTRFPFKRSTFFNRMADLRELGFLESIGRIGYAFTAPTSPR